jgi:hypothetical protein
MWGAMGFVAALLTLSVGTSFATVPPSIAYHFSSHPMISGTVVTVNDHQMVVNTDQRSEQVSLEVDSRTMAPRDLAPGMVMRAEFLALEDCHFYAERIMPVRGGMTTNRSQAYAQSTDSRETIERNATASGEYRGQNRESAASVGASESLPQAMGDHSPGATMTPTPTKADYHFSTRPMLSGGVVSVNDHRLVIVTDQGSGSAWSGLEARWFPEVAAAFMRAEFSRCRTVYCQADQFERQRRGGP